MKLTFDFKFEDIVDKIDSTLSRIQILDNKISPDYILKNAKDYEILFINSKFSDSKEIVYDEIFKLKNGLILYLSREQETPIFKLKVYYNIKQINELKMFLSTLKLWKE
jgi:hypothetical protein